MIVMLTKVFENGKVSAEQCTADICTVTALVVDSASLIHWMRLNKYAMFSVIIK